MSTLPPPASSSSSEVRRRSDKTDRLVSILVSYDVLLSYERTLSRTPYDVTAWHSYLTEIDSLIETLEEEASKGCESSGSNRKKKSREEATAGGKTIPLDRVNLETKELRKARNLVAERALSLLPGSYKLWKTHLDRRVSSLPSDYVLSCSASRSRYDSIISTFERSLVRMNKMPRIWLDYLDFVTKYDPKCEGPTVARRLFDRALLALPATQHKKIWDKYVPYVAREAAKAAKDRGEVVGGEGGGGGVGGVGAIKIDPTNGRVPPPSIPPETSLRVLRRYVRWYDPSSRETLIDVCLSERRWGEASAILLDVLNDVDFVSPRGTTRHELWTKLAEVCTGRPMETTEAGVDFAKIVRAALAKDGGEGGHYGGAGAAEDGRARTFDETPSSSAKDDDGGGGGPPNADAEGEAKAKIRAEEEEESLLRRQLGEMEGTLWTKLAEYRVRSGEFDLARSVYEEALESVSKARDFGLIFDAYMKFEEGIIEAMMEIMNDDSGDNEEDEEEEGAASERRREGIDDDDDDDDEEEEEEEDMKILLGKADASHETDVEMAMSRAEDLQTRRPLLLNGVLLRQNPHDVGQWLKRSDLYLKLRRPNAAVAALEEAGRSVHARKASNGTPHSIFVALANVHEHDREDVAKAREVYENVCVRRAYRFRDVDDYAQAVAAWAEFELRRENCDGALAVVREATSAPSPGSTKIERSLSRSLRLWNLRLDLEESLGTTRTTRDAYGRAVELKVATPAVILNFASFLTDRKYFEESYTAYERGLDLFPFPDPGAKVLWKAYLESFVDRYGGDKIHRVRELYDRCLEGCPPEDASEFFLSYGEYEEEHGLTKRALSVYERMCTAVPPAEKYDSYRLYVAKTMKYLGVTAARPVFERAIAALDDDPAARTCLDYAETETSLSEYERARTVLTYGAQLADPRRNVDYWTRWHEFEVSHGNEETFREMLRVKRSVRAAFSTVNYNAAEMGAGAPKVAANLTNEEALDMIAEREGVKANALPTIGGFVTGKRSRTDEVAADLEEVERRAEKLRRATAPADVTAEGRASSSAGEAREAVGGGDGGGEGEDGDDDDEIDVDDAEEEEETQTPAAPSTVRDVTAKAVPAAVFGRLASAS